MALSINGALSGAGTGAAIGSAIPGIGTAIGAIGGGILGLFGGKKDNSKEIAQMQFENEKELMGLQNQYNKEMAEANHERNKEIWDYTNYENQVEHMKNAGLSVGLMYGQGGGMGASTSGGQGQGVSNPGTTAVQAGLQARMMGVQLQNIQSQTALNSAQAAKAMSESEKIKGVDTEEKKVTIENIIAQTENEKERKALIKQNTRVEIAQEELLNTTSDLNMAKKDEALWNIRSMGKAIESLEQEIITSKLDNSLKAQVMNDLVKQASLTTSQMIQNITKTKGDIQEIAARIQKMGMELALKAEGNEIQWKSLELEGEKLLTELEIQGEKIDVAYKSLIVEAIKGVAQAAIGATAIKNSLQGRTTIKGFK